MTWIQQLPNNYNPIDIIGLDLINAHLTLEGIDEEQAMLLQYAEAAIEYTEHDQNKPCLYCDYVLKLADWPTGLLKLDLDNIDFEAAIVVKRGTTVIDPSLYVVDELCKTVLFDTENISTTTGTISITVKAGHQTWPARLKQIALIHLASFYTDREDVLIKGTMITEKLARKTRKWNA